MSIADNIRAVEAPSPKQLIGAYKDAKQAVRRVDVNSINVRFYPANSPFYSNTKGELYHFGIVTILKIEVPDKLAWIIEDDSILYDKATKEEWVEARPDYPLTLSANKHFATLLEDAMKAFPDVVSWYIPAAINRIPVRNIIVSHDTNKLKAVATTEETRNIVEWLTQIPANTTITPKFLYDYMDLVIVGSLKDDANKMNWTAFILGGCMVGLLVMGFMTYIG